MNLALAEALVIVGLLAWIYRMKTAKDPYLEKVLKGMRDANGLKVRAGFDKYDEEGDEHQ